MTKLDQSRRNDLPLLLIKTGSAIHHIPESGDFEQWIGEGMGITPGHIVIRSIYDGEELPSWEDFAGAVITGSAAMVTHRLGWSENCAAWLRRAVPAGFPVLGICYGHQLLAHAFGGRVERDPRGREIGTVEVSLRPEASEDDLFASLPTLFLAQVTHEESVVELPSGAEHLGSTKHTRNHVFRIGETAWGVQFHPEFGPDEMRIYLRARRDALLEEGLNPDRLLTDIRPGPWATVVLEKFAEFTGLLPDS